MTLSTQSMKAVAQGNGATTVWPYAFLVPSATDLIITLVLISSGNETVVAPSLFTVTGIGDPAGGSVTYPLSGAPLSALYKIVVERFVPDVQETDLVNQGGAYPQDIEDALDYLTMITQQQQDQLNRSIVFSIADTGSDRTLPVASVRAGKFLSFDADGVPIVVDELTPGTTVSAAMIPVVTAPTTTDALIALGISGGSTLLDLIIPSGVEWDYNAGGAAPTGFVYPIGQPCTPTYPDYRAKLIAAGSPYGNNGTDPLMPDKRSAVNAGKSNMGGVDNGLLTGGNVLGALLGTQTITLIGANLPPYTPTGNISVVDGAGLPKGATNTIVASGAVTAVLSDAVAFVNVTATFGGNPQGGSSTPVSVVQPTFICNKIIKVH